MRLLASFLLAAIFFWSCENKLEEGVVVIGKGEMPSVAKDTGGRIHVVYGEGNQIMYATSGDQGRSFAAPEVVNQLPELAASHMRGPQIAATSNGLLVTACTHDGDIYSFIKDSTGKWTKSARINDVDTVAKENLMALAAEVQFAYAVWLDLRDGQNKIFGSSSMDGGKTWSKNLLIYASPDSSVCECCKPSVLVKGNRVVVMFRNWLKGNRDMYIIESTDKGNAFSEAKKLGTGNWALNGCPMDGGGFVINSTTGEVNSVWRRKKEIYFANSDQEFLIGEGKHCTVETVSGKNIFAWVDDGNVIVVKPGGVKENLGHGSMPVLKAISNGQVICIWEYEQQVYAKVLGMDEPSK